MRIRKLDLRTILVWPPPFLPHEGQVCSVAQMDPYCCFPFWFSLQQFFAALQIKQKKPGSEGKQERGLRRHLSNEKKT